MRRNRRTCLPERSDSPKRTRPASSQLEVTRRIEPEGNVNETAVIYEKYLQTLMTEHLMKQKGDKSKVNILIQLTTLEKTREECQQQLHRVKIRINELDTLNEVGKHMETQIQQVNEYLAANKSKLTKLLDQIHSYLESFDKLISRDVIVPENSEDLTVLFSLLEQFNGVLDSIGKLIGDKSSAMTLMNHNLIEFNESFLAAEKLLKGVRENLENLQVQTLKTVSTTF